MLHCSFIVVGGPAGSQALLMNRASPRTSRWQVPSSTKSHFSSDSSGRRRAQQKAPAAAGGGGPSFVARRAHNRGAERAAARAVHRIAGYYDALEEKESKVSTSCARRRELRTTTETMTKQQQHRSEAPNSSCQGTTGNWQFRTREENRGRFRLSFLVAVFAAFLCCCFALYGRTFLSLGH